MKQEKTILIVDDEIFFRAVLKDNLADRYHVIEATNGDEAFEFALTNLPDLIIMDIAMPGSNGIEACRRLKSDTRTRRIPIILITSLLKKEDLLKGLQAGADDYITKPASLPEVVARVDAHLRSSDYYADLKHQDLLFLMELSDHIFATRNPMSILRLIVEKLPTVIEVERCSFIGLSEQGELVVKASNDLDVDKEIHLDLKKYPEINRALETKRPVLVENIEDDPLMETVRRQIKGMGFRSIIVVPMIKKESLIGTFFLRTVSASNKPVNQRVFKLCQLVANISASALENAILFECLKTGQEFFEEMSIRDGLTKLYNHRHFHTRLNHEFSRATRYSTPLSLVFFDVDDFKKINDTHGHTNGDIVLKKIGHIISSIARQSDVGARYGGDEFVLLLPNTSASGAYEMADRLHSAIRSHCFNCLNGGHVTISVGVATHEHGVPETSDELIKLADKAMYLAKNDGKDRVSLQNAV
jgi:two-component system cell cycle response regulator